MRIAVLYCTSGMVTGDRQMEQLAEQEVLVTSSAVQKSLQELGHQADCIDLSGYPINGLLAYDWVFNLVETTPGYDLPVEQLAAWMEKSGLPFTGSGSHPLKVCADKAATKRQLQGASLPTPRFEVIHKPQGYHDGLVFPLIVKPLHEEGSIGITKESVVQDSQQLYQQVLRILQWYQQPALVEEYIDGRDVAVSLLGSGQSIQALPVSEVDYAPEFSGPKILSYDAKWVPETLVYQQTSTRCPSTLDDDLQEDLTRLAIQACRLFGCQDYTRVDFRLQGRSAHILEINPNPCINPDDSGFVLSARAAGLTYTGLVNKILESSFSRYPSRLQSKSLSCMVDNVPIYPSV
jgi:D-alanine-D-alanine ligase